MALNTQVSDATANASCNAATARVNGGSIKIYTGPQPANGNTALTTQTLLATLPLNNPAFGNAAAGVAALNAAGVSATAVATGTAAWCRVCDSSGVGEWDASIGTAGCNLNMGSTAIQSGATVSVTAYSVYVAEAGN